MTSHATESSIQMTDEGVIARTTPGRGNSSRLSAVALRTWAQLLTSTEVSAAIDQAIADLVASSPASLDTLNELAAALGDDANFATTVTNALAGKVAANSAITGASKTKITYDSKGLVTAGSDATTSDIADSTDKRYLTDAQLTVVGNTSGTNTGDASGHSGLVPYTGANTAVNLGSQKLETSGEVRATNHFCPGATNTGWHVFSTGIYCYISNGQFAQISASVFSANFGFKTMNDFVCGGAGKGLQLQSGTGARAGNATLVAGTVTVTNTTVTANTVVYLSRKTSGGTVGTLSYTLSAGASFTINSSSASDTSVISYLLIEVN